MLAEYIDKAMEQAVHEIVSGHGDESSILGHSGWIPHDNVLLRTASG
jgi:hypothetical protein